MARESTLGKTTYSLFTRLILSVVYTHKPGVLYLCFMKNEIVFQKPGFFYSVAGQKNAIASSSSPRPRPL
ncbi:hypothetical protein ARTHRO_40917 [Limnospira indica PCC 8005]|uniref:Uncharacterized protein n=1 Tax=Limnospira indica PCC 8005 TaxID=376219 RepID=A0A9P1P026_9CYAN|nr:hypothetical protein ARTHRO_40917 [Limnospira indica PCC 8005]